ncbi:MAG: type II toxin-antitoxin system VapC family toxin [Balneolaceae bacterium]
MIVVDTNILAYFWLPSDHTELCEQLFKKDPEWIAPVLWKSEFRSVVTLYMRKNLIDLSEAIQITEKAKSQMKERDVKKFASAVSGSFVKSPEQFLTGSCCIKCNMILNPRVFL